jgi:DNA-binding MarR family transcriptional regulator/predicted N-acetyltransferase YhbS
MVATQVDRVRSFNRTVTAANGALDDHFLGRDRPLGQARVLWEIGVGGAQVRQLRSRLGFDSGYTSRLLRQLERQGLVQVVPDAADARVRRVRLTDAGLAERAELDRRAERLAASLLEPLPDDLREQLAAAMAQVERLLMRSQITIAQEPAASPAVQWCFAQYFQELDRRFENGFDASLSIRADVADLTPPAGLVLIARLRNDPVGCGALRFHADGVVEVKRMWVAPRVRGAGLGGRLLHELERLATENGATVAHLETNRSLVEAVSMYGGAGYQEVPRFSAEPYAHHWFEKRLEGAQR